MPLDPATPGGQMNVAARPGLDRRAALRRLAGHAAMLYAGGPAVLRVPSGAGWGKSAHPTPRPGVTAARVLTAARLRELGAPDAVETFDQVRQIPQIVDGIRCRCGCADDPAHYSLLSCYEGDGMARLCEICTGQGRMAFRLTRAGRSLNEVRAAVDARYG